MNSIRICLLVLFYALALRAWAVEPYIEADFIDLRAIQPAAEFGAFGSKIATSEENRTVFVAAATTRDPDDSGVQDGSVFVFTLGIDGMLEFEQTLETDDRNLFGRVLAASGDWAASGESGDKVHLYRRSGTLWSETQLLRINPDVPSTPGVTVRDLDSSADMDGSLLVIGDTSANVAAGGGTLNNAGAVVLFRRGINNVWTHEATLIAPIPVSSSEFGQVVAVSGDTVLVGAPNDAGPGGGQGGAYVFQRVGGTWNHIQTLRNPEIEQARYGWSVALDGDVAAVGCATCGSDPVFTNTGSFFAYERDLGGNNNWGQRGEFMDSRPDFIDEFSKSLFLSGDRILVGAPNDNRATFFRRSSTGTWTESQILEAGDSVNTSFGSAVAFFDNHAVIGLERWPNTSSSERWGAVSSWLQPICAGAVDGVFCDGFEG